MYDQLPGIRNSDLSLINDELFNHRDRFDPAPYYRVGTLLDAMITEPERVNWINKTCDGIKYAVKEFELCDIIRHEFIKNEVYRNFINNAQFQVIKTDEVELTYNMVNKFCGKVTPFNFRVKRKCKFDIYKPTIGGDIKTTTAKTQSEFESAINYFNYYRQSAWYMDIAKIDTFVIIGISKLNKKIFRFTITRDSQLYLKGQQEYTKLAYYLVTIKKCLI